MILVNNLIPRLHYMASAQRFPFAKLSRMGSVQTLNIVKRNNVCSVAKDRKGDKFVDWYSNTQTKLWQHLKDVRLILKGEENTRLRLLFSSWHRQTLKRLRLSGKDSHTIMYGFDMDSRKR